MRGKLALSSLAAKAKREAYDAMMHTRTGRQSRAAQRRSSPPSSWESAGSGHEWKHLWQGPRVIVRQGLLPEQLPRPWEGSAARA